LLAIGIMNIFFNKQMARGWRSVELLWCRDFSLNKGVQDHLKSKKHFIVLRIGSYLIGLIAIFFGIRIIFVLA